MWEKNTPTFAANPDFELWLRACRVLTGACNLGASHWDFSCSVFQLMGQWGRPSCLTGRLPRDIGLATRQQSRMSLMEFPGLLVRAPMEGRFINAYLIGSMEPPGKGAVYFPHAAGQFRRCWRALVPNLPIRQPLPARNWRPIYLFI